MALRIALGPLHTAHQQLGKPPFGIWLDVLKQELGIEHSTTDISIARSDVGPSHGKMLC